MAAYVDNAGIVYRSKLRYHLCADSLVELHAFADKINVKRCWFHRAKDHPHYDVTEVQRELALAYGAVAISSKALLKVAKSLVSKKESKHA